MAFPQAATDTFGNIPHSNMNAFACSWELYRLFYKKFILLCTILWSLNRNVHTESMVGIGITESTFNLWIVDVMMAVNGADALLR